MADNTARYEVVHGSSEAHLVVPDDGPRPSPRDPRLNQDYAAVCWVEVAENGEFMRRFAVHVRSQEDLPLALRAGRCLALVWSAANRRFGSLASRLRKAVVDVWLARGGSETDVGGEQFNNNIYVYDILGERTGIEWTRELAHEYGHYLLPGASGYTDPESWSNGILGERLFLNWLYDDVRSGRLDPAELPYVKLADLQEYRSRQIAPLIERMQATGPDVALLARTDRRAMDAFTALLLYVDAVYGSPLLMNMLDYLPSNASAGVRGRAFLDAFTACVSAMERLTLTLPSTAARVYLPAGTFHVRPVAGSAATLILRPGSAVPEAGGWRVRLSTPGWHVIATSDNKAPVVLRWERVQSAPSAAESARGRGAQSP